MNEYNKILDLIQSQNDVLTQLQVSVGKIEVDLSHHIRGTIQNSEAIQILKEEIKLGRDLHDKRMDSLEKQNLERLSIERGQARVFKWASIVLGLAATAVGLVYTISRFL